MARRCRFNLLHANESARGEQTGVRYTFVKYFIILENLFRFRNEEKSLIYK